MNGQELAQKVATLYGTTDVFELAKRAQCKIIYASWQPVTLGEYHRKTQTIVLNENIGENTEGGLEAVLAHELGHFFGDMFSESTEKEDAERIADEFARFFLPCPE